MSNPFLTYNDVYLILKPTSVDLIAVLIAAVFLMVLIYLYKYYKKSITKLNYILLSILIIFNASFAVIISIMIFKEAGRFKDLSHQKAFQEIVSDDFNRLYSYLDKKIKPDETYYFYNPTDPYFENVMAKFRLSYYLTPRKIAKTIDEANYLIVINYENTPALNITIPPGRKIKLEKITEQLAVIELIKNKPLQEEQKS